MPWELKRARLNKMIHDVVVHHVSPKTVVQYKALYGHMWESHAKWEREYGGRVGMLTLCGLRFRHRILPETYETTCLECIGTPLPKDPDG